MLMKQLLQLVLFRLQYFNLSLYVLSCNSAPIKHASDLSLQIWANLYMTGRPNKHQQLSAKYLTQTLDFM